ncbi:MAG TPA: thioesterase family protein [Flavobacteriales bacterium]|nr:thioesterase family protein [Flavobacteriales bacterium]
MTENEFFPIELNLRIDWSEMDIFGHVNNVMYMKYVQAARVNYWETIGMDANFATKGIGPNLASVTCSFKRPMFYPGTVIIKSRIDYIKKTSFGLTHRIYNDKNELCAEANDVAVIYDYLKKVPSPIPDWMRSKVEAIEKRKFPLEQ